MSIKKGDHKQKEQQDTNNQWIKKIYEKNHCLKYIHIAFLSVYITLHYDLLTPKSIVF